MSHTYHDDNWNRDAHNDTNHHDPSFSNPEDVGVKKIFDQLASQPGQSRDRASMSLQRTGSPASPLASKRKAPRPPVLSRSNSRSVSRSPSREFNSKKHRGPIVHSLKQNKNGEAEDDNKFDAETDEDIDQDAFDKRDSGVARNSNDKQHLDDGHTIDPLLAVSQRQKKKRPSFVGLEVEDNAVRYLNDEVSTPSEKQAGSSAGSFRSGNRRQQAMGSSERHSSHTVTELLQQTEKIPIGHPNQDEIEQIRKRLRCLMSSHSPAAAAHPRTQHYGFDVDHHHHHDPEEKMSMERSPSPQSHQVQYRKRHGRSSSKAYKSKDREYENEQRRIRRQLFSRGPSHLDDEDAMQMCHHRRDRIAPAPAVTAAAAAATQPTRMTSQRQSNHRTRHFPHDSSVQTLHELDCAYRCIGALHRDRSHAYLENEVLKKEIKQYRKFIKQSHHEYRDVREQQRLYEQDCREMDRELRQSRSGAILRSHDYSPDRIHEHRHATNYRLGPSNRRSSQAHHQAHF